MKTLKLSEVLKAIYDAGLENARFELTYNNETIFTSNQVFYEIADRYSSYKMSVSELFQPTAAYFIGVYSEYREAVKQNMYKAWKALTADYDPVSNYDMTEQEHDGKKLSTVTDTMTPSGGTETTVNRYGIDSGAAGEPYDKQTVQPLTGTKTENKREFTSDKTIPDNDGNTLTGYHDANDRYLQRKGNIGVTLASDMVTAEVRLRMQNDLLQMYVKEFIDRYCFTTGGEDIEPVPFFYF